MRLLSHAIIYLQTPVFSLRTSSSIRQSRMMSSLSSASKSIDQAEDSTKLTEKARESVWHEFSPMAVKHKAINLGQGFPSWDPEPFVVNALIAAVQTPGTSVNQYCRPACHLPLALALADEYNSRWSTFQKTNNIPILNPLTNVMSGCGVTQVLYLTMIALLKPGDEVILFEPAFDIYNEQVRMAGGVVKPVPLLTVLPEEDNENGESLDANEIFQIDWRVLEDSITDKTKVIVINTPHNPTGKVFSLAELTRIELMLKKYPNVIVVSDEVYENIYYNEDSPPTSFATISEEAFKKTLTLASAGKTFSVTGWKVGWAVGPENFVSKLVAKNNWIMFSSPSVTQDAVAKMLVQAREPYKQFKSFYAYLRDEYARKRKMLAKALKNSGFTPIVPAGGFFICSSSVNIKFPSRVYDEPSDSSPSPMSRDWALARYMTKENPKVCVIPPSAFYSDANKKSGEGYLRFAFCKSDGELEEAGVRLMGMKEEWVKGGSEE